MWEKAIKRKSQMMKLWFLEADSHHEPLHWKNGSHYANFEILFTIHERTYIWEIKSYVLQDVNWLKGNKATTGLLMKILWGQIFNITKHVRRRCLECWKNWKKFLNSATKEWRNLSESRFYFVVFHSRAFSFVLLFSFFLTALPVERELYNEIDS